MRTAKISLDDLVPDPGQPRKSFAEGEIEALSEDLRIRAQIQPIIVFTHAGKAVIVDGHRRWLAAKRAGLTHLSAVVLQERPSLADLRILQLSIDVRHVSFNAMERSNAVAEIQKETGWSIAEMVRQLSIRQSALSKWLAYQKLAPEIQDMLAAGSLDTERAFTISSLDDHEAQRAMLKENGHLSRQVISTKRRTNGKPIVKTKRAKLTRFGGGTIIVSGPDFTGEDLADWLNDMAKQVRKMLAQGHDVKAIERILKQKGNGA